MKEFSESKIVYFVVFSQNKKNSCLISKIASNSVVHAMITKTIEDKSVKVYTQ